MRRLRRRIRGARRSHRRGRTVHATRRARTRCSAHPPAVHSRERTNTSADPTEICRWRVGCRSRHLLYQESHRATKRLTRPHLREQRAMPDRVRSGIRHPAQRGTILVLCCVTAAGFGTPPAPAGSNDRSVPTSLPSQTCRERPSPRCRSGQTALPSRSGGQYHPGAERIQQSKCSAMPSSGTPQLRAVAQLG